MYISYMYDDVCRAGTVGGGQWQCSSAGAGSAGTRGGPQEDRCVSTLRHLQTLSRGQGTVDPRVIIISGNGIS